MNPHKRYEILGQPLELPGGAILKNRLIKAAMSDSLGDGQGNPTSAQMRLYERWSEGGAALSLIGEAQVDFHNPEKPGNLVLTPGVDESALRELARRGAANGAQIWPQLGHAGALSYLPVSSPRGPSPLDIEGLKSSGFSQKDLEELPSLYARAAKIAQDTGFGGVQVHAGHGFLLSQFLSPLFNRRADAYGDSVANRFRIIREVIEAIRNTVGSAFPIGIKINSTDKLVGGLTEKEALEVIQLLDQTSVDLIDISGGTYFPGAASSSDGASTEGPYFLSFAKRAREMTSIPLMATGGFTTADEAVTALEEGYVDAVGIARGLVLNPDLANDWLTGKGNNPSFPRFDPPLPRGGITAWYSMRLTALGEDNENLFGMSPAEALEIYDGRDAQRAEKWKERFTDLQMSVSDNPYE